MIKKEDVIYVVMKKDDDKDYNIVCTCISKEVAVEKCIEDYSKEYGEEHEGYERTEFISREMTRVKIYIGEYINIYYIVKQKVV